MILSLDKKIKILVAEDDELIRWSLERFLETAGYSVDIVANGKEAIQRLEEYNYDIVVTDLNMPEVNGVELLKRMREMKIFPPVIVISAYLSEYRLEEDLYRDAFIRCINKPFQMEDILNVVKEAVEYRNF
jgi:CheY-like chemotaxis protein